jgi:hypothetical protein
MVASSRQGRPQMPKNWCPFCPGSGNVPDSYDVYMYKNDFPALSENPPKPDDVATDFFKTEESYVDVFTQFIKKIPKKGFLVANFDDEEIARIAKEEASKVDSKKADAYENMLDEDNLKIAKKDELICKLKKNIKANNSRLYLYENQMTAIVLELHNCYEDDNKGLTDLLDLLDGKKEDQLWIDYLNKPYSLNKHNKLKINVSNSGYIQEENYNHDSFDDPMEIVDSGILEDAGIPNKVKEYEYYYNDDWDGDDKD